MLVTDWVLEVSVCSRSMYCSLLHHNHHIFPPVPLHMVMQVGFNLQSWLTTSGGYLDITSFNDINDFQLFGGSIILEIFSFIIFVMIHASKYILAIIYLLSLNLNRQGGWLSLGTGGEKLQSWGPDRKRIRNGIRTELDDPHTVRDHISSFAHYTVHFQFGNALMTTDHRLTQEHLQTENQTLQIEH
jgi:hypothetical protein